MSQGNKPVYYILVCGISTLGSASYCQLFVFQTSCLHENYTQDPRTSLISIKLPFPSQLINFINKYINKLAYLYMYTDKCFLWRNLSLKKQQNLIAHKYYDKNLQWLTRLNIIFDNFGMWFLGYRIEFCCVYIPQGHYFICTLWLWSTDEYIFIFILSESPPLKKMTLSQKYRSSHMQVSSISVYNFHDN